MLTAPNEEVVGLPPSTADDIRHTVLQERVDDVAVGAKALDELERLALSPQHAQGAGTDGRTLDVGPQAQQLDADRFVVAAATITERPTARTSAAGNARGAPRFMTWLRPCGE